MNESAIPSVQDNSSQEIPLESVWMIVNGQVVQEQVEPRLLLSDFLRHQLGLTGSCTTWPLTIIQTLSRGIS